MTSRERVICALSRKESDIIPRQIEFTQPVIEIFKQKTGQMDYKNYFRNDMRYIGPLPTRSKNNFYHYHNLDDIKDPSCIDEWGIARVRGDFYHFERIISPLRKAESTKEIEDFPWPDIIADYRFENYESSVKEIHKQGYAVFAPATVCSSSCVFEGAWHIRGLEEFLVDMAVNHVFAEVLLEKMTVFCCCLSEKAARAGADVLIVGDDVADQKGMMISMEMWRRFIKPRLKRIIESAKKNKSDIFIDYHCCGNPMSIIPELIEVGVDVLNPVQPECMDIYKVKREFGNDLSFRGGVGTQSVMPFGKSEDVKRAVKNAIDILGKNGGFIIAPSHVIEPDVSWENIMAFAEAIDEYFLNY